MTKRVDCDAMLPDDVFCVDCGDRLNANELPAWSFNVPLCKMCWKIRKYEEE